MAASYISLGPAPVVRPRSVVPAGRAGSWGLVFLAGVLGGGGLDWRGCGHDDSRPQVPALAASKTDEAMVVDGLLTEPFWSRCAVGTDLIDTRTQKPAVEQTLIRIAYTSSHLYLGVECLDTNMAGIYATERRDDRAFAGDDWVEVHVDPPHNHRGKYAFFCNPLGTKADANEGPSGVFNYGWSAEWDCAAQRLEDRWTFEMRIPFSAMNYFRRDGETWGFNLTRLQRRTDVTSFWSFSSTDMYKPRHFGHLTGLDLAKSEFDRNWEISPYASVRADFNGDTDVLGQTGVDVKFRLTPAVITSWTINPDFGQIEADDDTIELRDTERFLPEKRLFFQEGEELMRMPHRLYYSRRFTELDAGAKVSGQLQGLNFNAQDIYGDVSHDGTFTGNSSVVRVNQEIGQRSSLSYYAAGSALEQGYAVAADVDGYFFLTDAWRLRFQGALADEDLELEDGSPFKDSQDYLGSTTLSYEWYPWMLAMTYDAITDDFNPLLGYIPRRDIFGPSAYAQYNVRAGSGWYKEILAFYEPSLYQDSHDATTLRDHNLFAKVILRNDLGIRVGYDDEYHAPYHNHRTSAGLNVFASDYYRGIDLTWATGEFELTDYQEVILGKRFKFWERLPIRWDFNVRYEEPLDAPAQTVWLNRVVFDLFLRQNMWIKTSLQLRDSGVHNYSVIYGWKVRFNTWWYVVFNAVDDGDTEPSSSIMTKVTYTF